MLDLHAYFEELRQHLNLVKPEITSDFYITELCTLNRLRQGTYQLTSDNWVHSHTFFFHYALGGGGIFEAKLPSKLMGEQTKETLRRYGPKFKLKQYSPGRYSPLIEAYMPVSFEFEADMERAAIRMPGVSTYSYDIDEIDAEFMHEMAKYILGKPNGFEGMNGNCVAEESSVRTRQQLKHGRKNGWGAKYSLIERIFRHRA